jgi:cytochrome P450
MSAESHPSLWRHPILHLGDLAAARLRPGGRRAGWWEARLWLSVSPLAYVGLRLAGRRAVFRLGRFGTLVNDPVIGRRILTDADHFRTVGPGTHGELLDYAIGTDALLNMDGPRHEQLRRSLGPLFAPDASACWVDATVDGPIEAAVASLRAGEAVDLVRLVRVVTGRTTFALLGAGEPANGDEGYLASYRLGEQLVGMAVNAIRRGIRPAELERAQALVERLAAPGRDGWASGGGTIGRLRELGFDAATARSLIVVIILAGTETVTSAAPRIVATLLDHGRWSALAGGEPGAVDAAIEAGLRLVTPTEVIVRSCIEPTVVEGHRFRARERLFLSIYGMTRWPSLYTGDPEALRLGEAMPRELRHIWFGAGPHFCLGAPVARLQLRRMLAALAAFRDLRIIERRPARDVLFPAYGQLLVRAS